MRNQTLAIDDRRGRVSLSYIRIRFSRQGRRLCNPSGSTRWLPGHFKGNKGVNCASDNGTARDSGIAVKILSVANDGDLTPRRN